MWCKLKNATVDSESQSGKACNLNIVIDVGEHTPWRAWFPKKVLRFEHGDIYCPLGFIDSKTEEIGEALAKYKPEWVESYKGIVAGLPVELGEVPLNDDEKKSPPILTPRTGARNAEKLPDVPEKDIPF